MAGNIEKQFKEAIKAELKPLFLALRNDNKATRKIMRLLIAESKKTRSVNIDKQKFPEVQKVETTNPQKEVAVSNFPEAVKVKGIRSYFRNLGNKIEQIEDKRNEGLQRLISGVTKAVKTHVFKVAVENQTEVKFPKVQKVDFTQEVYKLLKQAEVQRVKIENSTPDEAVPVVLVDKMKKRFYEVLQIVSSAGKQIAQGHIVKSPTNGFASVGTSSSIIVASNNDRTDLEIVNDSNNEVYLSRGAGAAVVGSGIRLNRKGGSYTIDSTNLFRGAIRAISATAGNNVTITEGN